jgi:hypothetical protein
MTNQARGKARGLLRGLVVGLCATTALDWVSMALYAAESGRTRWRENAVRGHRHAYERAVERTALQLGHRLTDLQVATWGWRFHKTFGLLGGPAYLALRRRFPALRWGSGLVFGTAFFLVVDELLMPVTRLTPGPLAFNWKVHARGAAAHLAYGVAAETAARLMDQT